jgi:hypothetical protein
MRRNRLADSLSPEEVGEEWDKIPLADCAHRKAGRLRNAKKDDAEESVEA